MKGVLARASHISGEFLINTLPKVIHLLGNIGTIAMLLVGGGMFVHNIDAVHHFMSMLPTLVADLTVGLVVGMMLLATMKLIKFVRISK